MTAVIIAPRVEDPLSDTEKVVTGGYFQLRPSQAYKAHNQWVQPTWSKAVPFDGTEKTTLLDALPDVPYELYATYADGRGNKVEIKEFRTVTDSATPLRWENLTPSGGPGSTVPVPSNVESRLAALEAALGNVSGGATNLAGITDMSALMRQVNTRTTPAAIRDDIDAAAASHTHPVAQISTTGGAPSNGTYLRGDGVWATPPGTPAALDGWDDIQALAGYPTALDSAGTAAQVAGDIGGTAADPRVVRLRGRPVSSTAPTAGQQLVFDGTQWAPAGSATSIPIAGMPPGSVIAVRKDATTGFWPASWNSDGTPVYTGGSASAGVRPTSRGDIVVHWVGQAPHPPIVSSGTGGVRDNVDMRVVLP